MATANTVNMERFAFDVFVSSMIRFQVITHVPASKFNENIYDAPDFLKVLSRGYITYQLRKRDTWKCNFEVEFKSNGLKKFNQISELLKKLWEEMDCERKPPMDRIISSLAVTNELILFLFSKNRKYNLNGLAILWGNYFTRLEKEFEEAGGLASLYSTHVGSLEVFDKILDVFIPRRCCPYGAIDVSNSFNDLYSNPQSFDTLDKNDKLMLKTYNSMLDYQIGALQRQLHCLESRDDKTDSLENPGLGIPQHEKLLRDSLPPSVCAETSEEKFNESATEGLVVNTNPDVKLLPGIKITSPEGGSKNRGGPTGSPHTPEGQYVSPSSSQEQKSRRGSPRTPEGPSRLEQKRQKYRQLKKNYPEGQFPERGDLTGSPLSPEGQLKKQDGQIGSPLTPEGQSGSPSSSQKQRKSKGSPRTPEGSSILEQKNRQQKKYLEGQLPERGDLTGSPLSPEGQLKKRNEVIESPLTPEEQLKKRDDPIKSTLSPKGKLKKGDGLIGSLPTTEGQSTRKSGPITSTFSPERTLKKQGALSKSPLSPEGQLKVHETPLIPKEPLKDQCTSPKSPIEEESRDLGAFPKSAIDPEEALKDQDILPESPISPESQLKRPEASTGSPTSSQEQKHGTGSPRTPKSTFRHGQKIRKQKKK